MAVASSESVKHLAGGDILRMANNIVRFEGLVRAAPDKIHVKTVAMGDFIGDTQRSIEDFFDFIFGEDNKHITEELKKRAAISQVKKYEKKTLKSNHVTQGNSDDKRIKADLRHQLVMDPILGPLLNFTEILQPLEAIQLVLLGEYLRDLLEALVDVEEPVAQLVQRVQQILTATLEQLVLLPKLGQL
ncbi:hypothetical protein THAOC_00142, partial [Thalassiosira oceanica]